ncbi:hypothetical protein AC579_6161 [Pseudocercospora musae]|uniref:Uncharacterized protein n=1 Tax=Pseudocercospora musae TaxID=113226 RepID=A0A139IS40_9PEZI|nr:hypothetical protein AC579_6161 [Pseudocercospora musae]
MDHPIRLTSNPYRSVKQTAKEGLLSKMPVPNPKSEPSIPIPPPRIVTERPFPHAGAKLSLALTPHRLPGYPLYTNSPILMPRKWHQIYVRREKEKAWYWVHVPDVMTVEGLVDAISVGNARLAIVYVGNGTEMETSIEDELRDVPLSQIRSRLGIVEQDGDLRFALYQDLEV